MKRCLGMVAVVAVVSICGLVVMGCGAAQAPSVQDARTLSVAPLPAPSTLAPSAAAGKGIASDSASAPSAPDLSAATGVDPLIIRTGNMTIIVKDVSASAGQVSDLAASVGGQVMRTDSRYQGDSLYSTIVIKVPAESYDDVMARLRKLAVKVDSENSSSQDVTAEYVDLDARVKVLEAEQQQLMDFLKKTQNVDESLKVYRELTNVQSQIESIKGRINFLQKSAAMSTITVNARPEPTDKPIVEPAGWDPLRVVRDALRSLVTALRGLVSVVIYVLVLVLPIVVLIVIPLLIVRAIWRRLRRPKAK